MSLEWGILIFVWSLTFSLISLIPKNKRRIAFVAFLSMQVITNLFGVLVVEFNLISYPVRFFSEVYRASFTFEYFIYPSVCSIFTVFYPYYRSYLYRFGYYAAFSTAITVPEFFLEQYTDVINYIQWEWYWTWFTLFLTLLLSRRLIVWFFKDLSNEVSSNNKR
ncbi:hypothetical protein GCM10011351_07390 [Paraliobacillus quinghaiensis]|uniref:Uncharacterized protein n=1 Tax=Paraliobacillus quinghaiensis TaxID=470815 RepID=A0A917WS74_9BACI|nr:CBO0543 family protein [Paraliobacillus quinghaiensis]GGM24166.1 hypothetical protein GCM10011351_07390 [Paraliobacillus quinghaiensis]